MRRFQFTIRLTSDAEPGTGLGGEVVNEFVPRDARQRPVLTGAHLKGLMRETLQSAAAELWNNSIVSAVFGEPGASQFDADALLRIEDAVAPVATAVRRITRTAIGPRGTVLPGALRTTESVALGTRFTGWIQAATEPDSAADLAWRLALLAIPAVGGSRNRGCGTCIVEIEGESRSPGELLRRLHARLQADPQALQRPVRPVASTQVGAVVAPHVEPGAKRERAAVLRLVFEADTPICCPEIADKTNVLTSGFSIPASAVQGLLLTRLNAEDPDAATTLYHSPEFRAWPLLPCWAPPWFGADGEPVQAPSSERLPTPIRVSLTHRAAKFSLPGDSPDSAFADEAIEPYDWTKAIGGAPLKASDGVLLRDADGEVRLWKARSMPHVVTSHGVHHDPHRPDGRNLYTVDAMAPMVWQGLVVMPATAAERLIDLLGRDPHVAVGKSRTVRGLGRLRVERLAETPVEWRPSYHATSEEGGARRMLLVVQSPLRIADDADFDVETGGSVERLLYEIALDWSRRHGLPAPETRTWAAVGIRFGWNRSREGRQSARRVVLPGSVFALAATVDPERLSEALQAGVGDDDDRRRGFGALSAHPGKARGLFQPSADFRRTVPGDPARRQAVATAVRLAAQGVRLPSASQIRAVEQRVAKSGVDLALEYLRRQRDERHARAWTAWQAVFKPLENLLEANRSTPEAARVALELLADLSQVADHKELVR